MGLNWNTNPLDVFRRDIESDTRLDDDTRSHLRLWLRALLDKYTPDTLSQQTIMLSVAEDYRDIVLIGHSIRGVDRTSPEYARLIGLRVKLSSNMTKQLRVAGLSRKHMSSNGQGKKGAIFPPARKPKPAERKAEAVA